jgi:hypothetical protein
MLHFSHDVTHNSAFDIGIGDSTGRAGPFLLAATAWADPPRFSNGGTAAANNSIADRYSSGGEQ